MKSKEFLNAVGGKIRDIRKAKKLTQEKLAELSNLHPTYISDIENGKVNASIFSYYQIAQALSNPLSEIVTFPISKPERKIESELTEVLTLARCLDSKQKAIFISASRGLIDGIEKGC